MFIVFPGVSETWNWPHYQGNSHSLQSKIETIMFYRQKEKSLEEYSFLSNKIPKHNKTCLSELFDDDK